MAREVGHEENGEGGYRNWRITGMEVWDADYFDMEVPAHITICKDLTGEFQFGLVQGDLDGRVDLNNGAVRLEFS